MSLAAILFGVSALGGVVMAIMRFQGKETPPWASRFYMEPWRPRD